jgi:hypothetical protein
MNIIFRCDPALIDLLPPPVPARQALPDWLRQMAPRVPSELHQRSIRTVKQCPPFVDAMAHGFMVLLPCDVQVAAGRFHWDWPLPELSTPGHPRAPLSFHVPEQLQGSPLAQGQDVAIKFNSFWTIELEPGWSLMVGHPVNRLDLPFRLLSGRVDADNFHGVGINFPALWTDKRFTGVLPRGTPVAQCYPVPRSPLDLRCETMAPSDQSRHEQLVADIQGAPGVYRRQFRGPRDGG